ncbi:hypothetical protein ACQUWL_20290 [Serratia marcescens]|uniref:hypothetical protein n=1 Tax=Serratia marcescens TaxID=615 RepID=UPI003D1645AC
MKNGIAENRRLRLKEWFAGKPIPSKEKSYLSQLMTGKASFGERAARRIERDYGMPQGHLDVILHLGPGTSSEVIAQSPRLTDQQKEILALLDSLPSNEINRLLDELREKKKFYDSVLEELLAKKRNILAKN